MTNAKDKNDAIVRSGPALDLCRRLTDLSDIRKSLGLKQLHRLKSLRGRR